MKLLNPYLNNGLEAGCDEAGRGCLAGPVVAAAVIFPPELPEFLLTDSKQMTEKQRLLAEIFIKENALCWAVGVVSEKEIDRINIANASYLAMHLAIDQLPLKPEILLIDGNRFSPYPGIIHQCIIKGDSKILSIAAASILAKCERDRMMEQLDTEYPQYGWKKNKGYPTKFHRDAIAHSGISPYHRKSFRLL